VGALIVDHQLLQVSVDVQSSMALFGRIFELIELRPRVTDRADALTIDVDDIRGEVVLDHVSFRYGGGEAGGRPAPDEALRDVSMLVSPGQLAALVGPSGAGKTTISYLIPRLYDVDQGAIRIDGHDVRDLTAATIAHAVGVVTQESYLFGGPGGRVAGYRRETSSATISAAGCDRRARATLCPAHCESASISPVVPTMGGAGE
jgi:ABC-type multidrug transport system fused ATPase/permease subunit